MSNSSDRVFIPFNFSSIAPFDSVASALNQLSTLQLEEPDGPFSKAYSSSSTPPSADQLTEMRQMMVGVVQDEYVICNFSDLKPHPCHVSL